MIEKDHIIFLSRKKNPCSEWVKVKPMFWNPWKIIFRCLLFIYFICYFIIYVYQQFLGNLRQYNHRWPYFDEKFGYIQILSTNKSKRTSEDYKKIEIKMVELFIKIVENIFFILLRNNLKNSQFSKNFQYKIDHFLKK